MTAKKLIVKSDYNSNVGLIYQEQLEALESDRIFSITSGNVLAHDLLEHPDLSKNHLYYQEIMAFGGICYVRDENFYYSPDFPGPASGLTFIEAIAKEVFELAMEYYARNRIPPAFREVKVFDYNKKDYESIAIMGNNFRALTEEALENKDSYQNYDGFENLTKDIESFIRYHENLLVAGFRIAKRRFRDHYKAAMIYRNVEQVGNLFFKQIHSLEDYENFEVILNYTMNDASMRFKDRELAEIYGFDTVYV